MNIRRWLMTLGLGVALLHLPVIGMSCGSFSPTSYFTKNACDIVNCDVLFFVDDMFPLSGGPTSGGGGAAAPAEVEVEEEGGGHMH